MSGARRFNLIYAKLHKRLYESDLSHSRKLIWGIEMAGKLYIVATPIGNLEDISKRAERTLKEVDLIFAEDTRVSIKLLSHLGISKTLISCHDHNEAARAKELLRMSQEGKNIALISDAGTPLVSDPGYKLLMQAIELGMEIIPVPGPSAVLLALLGSGLPAERFAFEGFLPDKAGERRRRLELLKSDDRTLIFFMPVSDIKKILGEILELMGNRRACLCRELTKLYEEFIRGRVVDILKIATERTLKGECVLVLEGCTREEIQMSEEDVSQRLLSMLEAGAKLKDAASLLAKEAGWSSSDIYKLGLKLRATND